MISKDLEKAINEQIKVEEQSSRIYMAMASWCEAEGYEGAAKFLYTHSDEERQHMLKFVYYLNDRGGHAQLQKVEEPDAKFKSLGDLFEEVMKHEQFVSKEIDKLVDLAYKEKDHATANFLQWYVQEQIEEESLFSSILDKFRLAGDHKGALYHLDRELGQRATAHQ
ncbi:MAG: ferritin [Bacteroidales bacterium]|nr:ferritin [Bacteroidales bacterium]